jgi:hypothetical protein
MLRGWEIFALPSLHDRADKKSFMSIIFLLNNGIKQEGEKNRKVKAISQRSKKVGENKESRIFYHTLVMIGIRIEIRKNW